MNEQIREYITKLYKFYFEEVRQTAITCESSINETPHQVYMEIRHAFDHIAKAEVSDLSEKEAFKTLESGLAHFHRSIVESWEIMVWSLNVKIDNIINNLEMSIYYRVFRGHFYTKLIETQKQSLKLFVKAREIKSEKYDEARKLFQEAYALLDGALNEFFKETSSEEYLRHRDKVSFIFWIMGLALSCGLGIVIALFF